MMEFLIEFKEQFISFAEFMIPIAIISFMTLGIVWTAGRLLGLVKTDHSKNILAAFTIPILSFLYQKAFISVNFEVAWGVLELTTFSVIFYVAFCWKLYYRIDSLLDKKIGEDTYKPTKKKRKK